MPTYETNKRKIVKRLLKDGWQNIGGSKHDKYEHPKHAHMVIVPRTQKISDGVAKSIAKAAGWI